MSVWISGSDGMLDDKYELKVYSLNKDVADFNEDGYLEGISDGTATIVAEWGGKIGTATVVVKTTQKLQAAYFEQGVYNMKMGDRRQLEVSTLPENAWISASGWKSSNPQVITPVQGQYRAFHTSQNGNRVIFHEKIHPRGQHLFTPKFGTPFISHVYR